MTAPDTHAHVKARIWKEIAQADLDLSALPKETLDQLVNLAAEAALVEVDDRLNASLEASKPQDELESEENILWEGRPFLSIATRYVITNERIRIIEGILGKTREDIELVRVQDIDQSQTLRERMLKLGDVMVKSHDDTRPTMVLNNVKNPEEVHEILRRAVIAAREKYRLSYREEM